MVANLTEKQRRFVQEYLVDLNASAAARRAGYSVKTANEQGARLMSVPKIQAAICAEMAERQRRVKITQDMVIKELAAIGFANCTDFLTVSADGHIYIKPTEQIPPEKLPAIANIKYSANGLSIELKLYDKVRALELLGKHLGLFDNRDPADDRGENNILELISQCTAAEIDLSEVPEIEPPALSECKK